MNYKEIDRLLSKHDWKKIRQKGSHCQYKKDGIPYVATIPNNGKDISIGVIKDIERGTGLSLR